MSQQGDTNETKEKAPALLKAQAHQALTRRG
jgi:hypothetical protein